LISELQGPLLRDGSGSLKKPSQQIVLDGKRTEYASPFLNEADSLPRDRPRLETADALAVEHDLTATLDEPHYGLEKATLAGPVGSQQGDDLPLARREIGLLDHNARPVTHGKVFDFQKDLGHPTHPQPSSLNTRAAFS